MTLDWAAKQPTFESCGLSYLFVTRESRNVSKRASSPDAI